MFRNSTITQAKFEPDTGQRQVPWSGLSIYYPEGVEYPATYSVKISYSLLIPRGLRRGSSLVLIARPWDTCISGSFYFGDIKRVDV